MRTRTGIFLFVIIFAAAAFIGLVAWWLVTYRQNIPPGAEMAVPARPVQPVRPPAAQPRAAMPSQAVVPKYRTGQRIGEIEIPRLHLAVPVFEGDNDAVLDRGAGHVPGTAEPGNPGNVCIAAHRDKFFRKLRFIKDHDEIVLRTDQGQMRYQVISTAIVKPDKVRELLPAPHRDLTLVTCYPFYYVGHAPKRFIVHATRDMEIAEDAPAGVPQG